MVRKPAKKEKLSLPECHANQSQNKLGDNPVVNIVTYFPKAQQVKTEKRLLVLAVRERLEDL